MVALVVSDGRLSAIGQPITGWGIPGQARGIVLNSGSAKTYAQIYRSQPAIRTVVDFIARGVADLPLKTFERVDDTDRVRLSPDKSDLASILEIAPNPSTVPYRLIHATYSDRAIYDIAYWLKVRDTGGRVVGVRRIPPTRVEPCEGSWLEVTAYRIFGDRGFLDRPREDWVVFPGYDPEDTRVGTSPIETLRLILTEEESAGEYRNQLWRSGARTGGVIERPLDAPEWLDADRNRFIADWSNYAGSGGLAGQAPVLEDGMKWVASGVTPKEAQYVESRKLTREEAAAAYHIPPPLVGILDHATFSNIREQHKMQYMDTLGPWLTSGQQEVRAQLVPDFYDSTQVYVEFDLNAKLRGDFEEQSAQIGTAVGGPWMTRNEGRARVNLPAIDGGDELVVPLNVTEGGQSSPADATNDTNEQNPAPDDGKSRRRGRRIKAAPGPDAVTAHVDLMTRFFERQGKSVTAAYSRAVKSVSREDVIDLARWDRELAADLLSLAIELSTAVGTTTMAGVNPDGFYDPGMTTNYLKAQTAAVAESVNLVTGNQITAALADEDDPAAALESVFATAVAARAVSLGTAQATNIAGWASVESGRQSGTDARKVWITGHNPRKSHQAMNGQTVALDAKFSNGARWPADAVDLSVDEVAGCNCALEIIPGGLEE